MGSLLCGRILCLLREKFVGTKKAGSMYLSEKSKLCTVLIKATEVHAIIIDTLLVLPKTA